MKKYRLILREKPSPGDTIVIDGKTFTCTENEFISFEFEADSASETLTDAGSYLIEL